MKRLISILLAAVILVAGLPMTVFAGHTHTGVLQSLKTTGGQSVPCCGVFRCSGCGETYEATVTPADVGMPIVKVEGSLEGISKTNKVTVSAAYDDGSGVAFTSSATLKWQGGSSVSFPIKQI